MTGWRGLNTVWTAALVVGCSMPALTRDGQLVFAPEGRRGATVLTANGVEFLDRNEVPSKRIRKSAFEPWQPATGFLLPADGVLRHTSRRFAIGDANLAASIRLSDAYVPSWGGELLVRLDWKVLDRARKSSQREAMHVALIVDGRGRDTRALASVIVGNLGARDRIAVIDAVTGAMVVPMVRGRHHSLLNGAIARRLTVDRDGRRLRRAFRRAGDVLSKSAGENHRVEAVVLSDRPPPPNPPVERLRQLGARLSWVSTTAAAAHAIGAAEALDDRVEWLNERIPPPGPVRLADIAVTVSGAPSPVKVLEASGGDLWPDLDSATLRFGDGAVGDSRSEVVRVAVPEWVSGEKLKIDVALSYTIDGRPHEASRSLVLAYSDDLELLASRRHGDVIAYASGLAMVKRLQRVFNGRAVDQLGGIHPLVDLQVDSLRKLSKSRRDPALAETADLLATLLRSVPRHSRAARPRR